MKVKTIYRTTEAIEGYGVEYNKVSELCNTKEEFRGKIKIDKILYLMNIQEKYSFESSLNNIKEFLEKENLI